jgi:hypothetical protein
LVSRVHLVGVAISFEKNFYRLPFTPPPLWSPVWSFNLIIVWTKISVCSNMIFGFVSLDVLLARASPLVTSESLSQGDAI